MAMYLIEDLIRKKRDGLTLDGAEIRAFVKEVSTESISDAQIAAFCMAVWFQGMDLSEQMAFTLSMRDSGEVLQWNHEDGPVLDKHSTGGVGDLVSLVLGSIVAACGARIPMISGRGLGHTGGTIDKLESIPGFDTSLSVEKFQRLVQNNGIAIIGQTRTLAPADRRFYAVRDVTATVASPRPATSARNGAIRACTSRGLSPAGARKSRPLASQARIRSPNSARSEVKVVPSQIAQSISISRESRMMLPPCRRIRAVSTVRTSGLDTHKNPSTSGGRTQRRTSSIPEGLNGTSVRPWTRPVAFHSVGP